MFYSGGWLIGDVDTHDLYRISHDCLAHGSHRRFGGLTRSLRKAQYPQPIENFRRHRLRRPARSGVGIDPQDVSFSGTSAGANMAFGALLYLRDHGKAVNAERAFYGAYGLRDSRSMHSGRPAWDSLTEADYSTIKALGDL